MATDGAVSPEARGLILECLELLQPGQFQEICFGVSSAIFDRVSAVPGVEIGRAYQPVARGVAEGVVLGARLKLGNLSIRVMRGWVSATDGDRAQYAKRQAARAAVPA